MHKVTTKGFDIAHTVCGTWCQLSCLYITTTEAVHKCPVLTLIEHGGNAALNGVSSTQVSTDQLDTMVGPRCGHIVKQADVYLGELSHLLSGDFIRSSKVR